MKLIFAFLMVLPILESKFSIRINKVECGASMKTAVEVRCFIKSYNRASRTMNGGFKLSRKAPNGKVNFEHYRQVNADLSYEKVLQFHNVDVCTIIEQGSSNFFFSKALDLFRSLEGNILDLCHSKEYLSVANVSLANATLVRMFPAGEHKTSIKFFDHLDDNIAYVTFYSTIRE